MKAILLFAVLLIVSGCSDSDTLFLLEEQPLAAPSVIPNIHYEIPEGVHPNLAAHFATFQSDMTEREFQFVLKNIHDYCYGGTVPFESRMKINLSQQAFQRLFDRDDDIDLIPSKRLREKTVLK